MSELRKDSLSFFEALGQSVASVAPTFTPALGVAVVAGMAGSAAWLVYVCALVGMLVVALNIGELAKRIPAAGSFLLYVTKTIGPAYGMLAAWAMLLAYLFTVIALTVACSMFFKGMIASLGLSLSVPNDVIYLIITAAFSFLAYRDIKFSSRLGLILEAISVSLIMIVCGVIWAKLNFEIDPKQIHLQGASFGTVAPAIVFGIFSWVGFESAATLGNETRNPKVVIPRVIVLTALITGIFFVVTTAIIVMGFGDDATKLGNSAAPMNDIATAYGFSSWVAVFIYIGAFISCFACTLGQLNAFARMLYALGRYQFVHKSMGMVHSSHRTPHVAIAIGAAINLAMCVGFANLGETNLYGYFGTIATFGFITVYLLCSICVPILLHREGTAKPINYILGGVGAVAMVLSFFGSVYPVPAAPYNYFPYGFVVYMLIGTVWFFVAKARSPQVILNIEHDLDGLAAGAE
jgi:amino acid transporter